MLQGTFAELGVPSELVEVLDRRLITEPFEIQALAIPDALVGRDILGRAPTGSGKTLAFGLPMLARLEPGTKKRPRSLILSPTRELAEQICRELEPLAEAMDRSVLAVYGGVGLDRQIRALRKGVDVLVACPGRLLDLIEQRAVQLSDVDIVVVDEADRMADMGFLPDVKRLLDQTNDVRQTVLFSATLDKDVQVLIDRYQDDPVVHEVGEAEPDLSTMTHRFIKVKKTERVWLSADIIDATGPTVVFVRTRHGVDRLARQLKNEGVKAGYIHGGRSQSQRDRALKLFIDGKVDALVATDVAARGIHVDGVACVIHYDPPAEIKDYVHRSGRTARAGADGVVVSFLDPPQVKESQKMQRKLGLEAEIEPVPARMPRSSRPESVDVRDKPPTRTRSGKNGKSGKPGKSGPPSKGDRSSSSGRPKSGGPKRAGRSGGSARSTDSERSGRSKAGASRDARTDSRSDSRSEGRSERGRPRSGSKATSRSGDSRSESRAERGSARSGSKTSSDRPSGTRKPASKPGPGRAKAKKSPAGKGSKPVRGKGAKSTRPGSGPKASTGKATGGGKRSARPATGKGSGAAAKSKRSGKPRPKNRKNKPKAGGRK